MSNISEIIAGLAVIKKYNAAAPIVTCAYRIQVPLVQLVDITNPADVTILDDNNWFAHPVYGWLMHWASTITEIVEVDGGKVPTIRIPIPKPPIIPGSTSGGI